MLNRPAILAASLLAALSGIAVAQAPSTDPLPSWNDGPARQAIIDFDKALDEATAKRWTIVDMKHDWKEIFPPAK